MSKNSEKVKCFFECPEIYLDKNLDIRVRADTVRDFVGYSKYESILDIGCGNGAVSLPMLNVCNHLTLLDLSQNMLAVAYSNTPRNLLDKVSFINEDFMAADLPVQGFDLILCLGILAHVDSPECLIDKIASLLKPGGSVIIQNFDIQHPVGCLLYLYSVVKKKLHLGRYDLNMKLVGSKTLERICRCHGLNLSSLYRYNLFRPRIVQSFIKGDRIYRFMNLIYGARKSNYGSWLGCDCIYHFKK